MAISDRIQAMYTHTSDIYGSVELTGVDTTDIDKNLVNVPNTLKEGYIDILNNGTDTLYNNFPKVSGEGTSLTLNNTYQAPMRNNLKGNTSQTGTPTPTSPIPVNVVSGDNEIFVNSKNFLKLNDIVQTTTHGITYSCKDGVLTLNGTVDSGGFIVDFNTCWLPSGTYYLARNSSGTSTGSWQNYLRNSSSQLRQGYGSFTTTIGQNVFYRVYANSGVVFNNYVLKPSITIGMTAPTDYDPYQGNTYNIDLPVENLLDLTQVTMIGSGSTQSNIQTNSLTLNGKSAWSNTYFFITNTFKNTNYTASCKALSSIARKSGISIYGASDTSGSGMTPINGVMEDMSANVSKTYINSFNSGNYEYLAIRFWTNATGTSLDSNVDLNISEIMLQKGTKANSFTPYGTTPIELCKIGNYQDYFYKDSDKWYLHKEIGKVVLNGSENWTYVSARGGFTIDYTNVTFSLRNTTVYDGFSNYFMVNKSSTTWVNVNYCGWSATNVFWLQDNGSIATTVNDFKTWLSTHNTNVYYVLATPTNTEITDTTLINQLEQFYQAQSKNNQTNISQINNDLGFIISASALKKG